MTTGAGAAALALAHQHGVTMTRRGDMLLIRATVAPPEVVLAALREAKPDLLRLLAEAAGNDPSPVPPMDAAGPLAPCPRCQGSGWWRTSAFPSGTPGPWRCSGCSPPPAGTWVDACALPGGHA